MLKPEQAVAIQQPVLSVIGRRSPPFRQAQRNLLHTWLPQTEDLNLDTTHTLQMEDPKGVAHGLAEFFSRHPMT
jgi:pimeloyl-ACP methyl ester carboxylesterase